LVLTAITVVLYGGNDDRKEKMEENFLYNKGRAAIDGFWTLAWSIANLGSEEINNEANQADGASEESEPDIKTGFWPELMEKIKDEWENQGAESELTGSNEKNDSITEEGLTENGTAADGLIENKIVENGLIENELLNGLAEGGTAEELVESAGFDFKGIEYLEEFSDASRRRISWSETEAGGVLIFRTKTDKEYKLPLPFRFLKSDKDELGE